MAKKASKKKSSKPILIKKTSSTSPKLKKSVKTSKKNIVKKASTKKTMEIDTVESDEDIDDDNKDFDDYTDPSLVQKLKKVDDKDNTKDMDYMDESDDDDIDIDIDDNIDIMYNEEADITLPEFINKHYTIPNNKRTTSATISDYEYCELITKRAAMISLGHPPLVNIKNIDNEEDIAKLEIKTRTIPLILKREVGIDSDGRILVELWDPKQMALPMNI